MTVPDAVRAAWGWDDAEVRVLTGGLINATYLVARDDAPIAVVQRLHPIFGGPVNLDLERVTAHLAGHGLVTPRLIRTGGGEAWITVDEQVWRALTWVDGVAVHTVPSLDHAREGGALVGRFHRAVDDLEHAYAFTRAGVHDTAAHLGRLRGHLDGAAPSELVELGHAILAAAIELPALGDLPLRHSHGDLKISNLLFTATAPVAGVALVDLDTLGRQHLGFELGDAMRSWCNPRGEDAGAVTFDLDIFAAAIGGWTEVAGGLVSAVEKRAIVDGLETACVELAARFANDVFEDRYFGWDPARFPSRRAHNLVRARGQLALAAAVRGRRDDALAVVLA